MKRKHAHSEVVTYFLIIYANFIASFGVNVETVDRVTPLSAKLLPTAFGPVFIEEHF
jgi:hypothetical protein